MSEAGLGLAESAVSWRVRVLVCPKSVTLNRVSSSSFFCRGRVRAHIRVLLMLEIVRPIEAGMLRNARFASGFVGSVLVAVLAFWSLSGDAARADELTIAVASNFLRPMTELAERFEAQTGHRVRIAGGSTGSHYAQIQSGAPYDLFFAADAERPKRLEQAGRISPDDRFTYAVGRLVLWSPRPGYVDGAGRVLEEGTFRHLAIANPALAPYGAAAKDVLEARGLWNTLQRRLVRGQDIGQTFSFVHSGAVELGFVAYAQILSEKGAVRGSWWLVPSSLHGPIEQQGVLLRESEAARAFVEFVKSDDAKALIARYGYGD